MYIHIEAGTQGETPLTFRNFSLHIRNYQFEGLKKVRNFAAEKRKQSINPSRKRLTKLLIL